MVKEPEEDSETFTLIALVVVVCVIGIVGGYFIIRLCVQKREKKVVFDKNATGTISNHVISRDSNNKVVDTTPENSQPDQQF